MRESQPGGPAAIRMNLQFEKAAVQVDQMVPMHLQMALEVLSLVLETSKVARGATSQVEEQILLGGLEDSQAALARIWGQVDLGVGDQCPDPTQECPWVLTPLMGHQEIPWEIPRLPTIGTCVRGLTEMRAAVWVEPEEAGEVVVAEGGSALVGAGAGKDDGKTIMYSLSYALVQRATLSMVAL